MRVGEACIYIELKMSINNFTKSLDYKNFRFIFNSGISIIDQVLGLVMTLVITSMLARHFGAAELGNYTIGIAIASLISVFTNMGIQASIRRNIAIDNSITGFQLSQAIIIRIFLSLPLSILAVHICISILGFDFRMIILCHLINLFIFSSGLYALSTGSLFSLHLNKTILATNLTYRLTTIMCLVLITLFNQSLEIYVICIALIMLFVFMSNIKKITTETQPLRFKADYKFMINLIVLSAPLTLAAAAEYANLKIDSLILGHYHPPDEVGFYTASFNLLIAFTMIPLAITKVFFPNFLDIFHNESQKKAARMLVKIGIIFFIYGFISLLLIFSYSENIIILIFGDGFFRSISILDILCFGVPIIALNRLFNYILVALKLNTLFFRITLIGLLINLLLNFILIPRYMAVGAAISTLVSEFIVMLLGMIILSFKLKNTINVNANYKL